MPDKFDAIVVGAGPAGSAAAYSMAKAGLSVLLIERGEFPGSKNTSGAVFYGEVLNELMPGFWREAPVERWINNQVISILGEGSSINIKTSREQTSKPVGVSVLRSKFDRWLAQKAVDAGATLLTSSLVDDLLWEKDRVTGVRVAREQGEVLADVVIIADGANSLLSEKAKLRGKMELRHVAVAVKELIKLPENEIEQHFQLSGNEGAAYSFLGEGTKGLPGGCFLYTNRESLSIGLIVNLHNLQTAGIQPFELLDGFKEHQAVAPLIAGGIVKEYSAHLIPEAGYDAVPKLFANGVLVVGDAAGLTLNSGFTLRGMDLAIASGIAAAETVKQAKKNKDYSAGYLSYYRKLLEQGFVLKDLKRVKNFSRLLNNKLIYREYPAWACRVANRLYNVGTKPALKMTKIINGERPRSLSLWRVISDIFKVNDL